MIVERTRLISKLLKNFGLEQRNNSPAGNLQTVPARISGSSLATDIAFIKGLRWSSPVNHSLVVEWKNTTDNGIATPTLENK